MKTQRKDVIVVKRKCKCPKSSFIGFSNNILRCGDMFVYKNKQNGYICVAKMHGMVQAIGDTKWYILAQVFSHNLQFTFERWVEPEWVLETIPGDRISMVMQSLLLELEINQQ